MTTNVQMKRCITHERGALLFWSPDGTGRRLTSRVQILDVFSLRVATSYTRDHQGRLLLEAQPSLAAGRSLSLAKAAQLIRNDVHPHRWVALQHCRQQLLPWATSTWTGMAMGKPVNPYAAEDGRHSSHRSPPDCQALQ
ncbi:MAG: hypothetical protein AB1Z22_00895 [Synechococcaceae cyanobacterium]